MNTPELPDPARRARRATLLLVMLLGAIFAAIYTPHWHRGGDSDVYLAIARSLARGEGLTFNGNPVVVVPPLWPLLLAGAMKISTSFLWLKLLPTLLLMAALVTWFRILLRWTCAPAAGAVVCLSALMQHIFPLTGWFFSEPLFLLMTSLSLLLALQVAEGRPAWWRGGLIVVLLAASVGVRWTAPLWWAVVAAALISTGDGRVRRRGAIIAAIACAGAVGAFYLQRWILQVDPGQIDPRFDSSLAVRYSLANAAGWRDVLGRIGQTGAWIGGLLWMPTRELAWLRWPGLIAGWMVLAPLCIWAAIEARRWRWVPLAVVAHVFALAVLWPNVVPRYLVPLLPVVLLFSGQAMVGLVERLLSSSSPAAKLIARQPAAAMYVSVAVVGSAFFAMEVWAVRTGDFYDRFQAGTNRSLIDAVSHLRSLRPGEGEVAINRVYTNFRRQRIGNGWLRAANVLLDQPIRHAPDELFRDVVGGPCRAPDDRVAAWLFENRVRWLLHCQPSVTMWHLRRPPGEDVSSPTGEPWTGAWQLLEVTPQGFRPVPFPAGPDSVRRVPGL